MTVVLLDVGVLVVPHAYLREQSRHRRGELDQALIGVHRSLVADEGRRRVVAPSRVGNLFVGVVTGTGWRRSDGLAAGLWVWKLAGECDNSSDQGRGLIPEQEHQRRVGAWSLMARVACASGAGDLLIDPGAGYAARRLSMSINATGANQTYRRWKRSAA